MKQIIICCDGTWNKPGKKDQGKIVHTNVEKLYTALCEENNNSTVQQVKFYDSGVGTGFTFSDKMLGGITGQGINKNIQDAYKFLICNYEKGDHIFLFGFSRGAYTVRSLAGLIHNCGVLKSEHLNLVSEAYNLYRDRNEFTAPDSDLMKGFKKQFCVESVTRIKMIGVWDTVGALGIPLKFYQLKNKEHYQFHDVVLSNTVDYAYHALAIDEKRYIFKPTLWKKSTKPVEGKSTVEMEQRWFCGVHCNVGGGYADARLSDIPLIWIMEKAEKLGLCFDSNYKDHHIHPDVFGTLRNSITPIYWFSKKKKRFIKKNEEYFDTVDESVFQRIEFNKKYKPKNIIEFIRHTQFLL